MGTRMEDALEALRRCTGASPKNSWGSIARGDQAFYAALFRGRIGTAIALVAAAALVALLVALFR